MKWEMPPLPSGVTGEAPQKLVCFVGNVDCVQADGAAFFTGYLRPNESLPGCDEDYEEPYCCEIKHPVVQDPAYPNGAAFGDLVFLWEWVDQNGVRQQTVRLKRRTSADWSEEEIKAVGEIIHELEAWRLEKWGA